MHALAAAVLLAAAPPALAADLHLSLQSGAEGWSHPPEDRWAPPDAGAPRPPELRWRTREVLTGGGFALVGWASTAAVGAWGLRQVDRGRPGDAALAVTATLGTAIFLPPWFTTVGVSLAADDPGHPWRAYFGALAVHLGGGALLGYGWIVLTSVLGPELGAALVALAAVATELGVMPAVAAWRYAPQPDDGVRVEPEPDDPWSSVAPRPRGVSVSF